MFSYPRRSSAQSVQNLPRKVIVKLQFKFWAKSQTKSVLFFTKYSIFIVYIKSGRFMYQSGRAGDEAKKRKSPAKSGRVGITASPTQGFQNSPHQLTYNLLAWDHALSLSSPYVSHSPTLQQNVNSVICHVFFTILGCLKRYFVGLLFDWWFCTSQC